MKAATLSQATSRIPQPAPYPLEGLTKTSTRKTAVLVGLCFLVATFTFAIGSALIHSHFSSGTSRDGTLVAGVFLLASTALAAVALSGAAGLILSSALWTSWLVPRNVSMLGLIGYPVFLVGTVLAMFNLIHVTHGAGMLALVPGGLFELILPIWLVAKGFASPRITR